MSYRYVILNKLAPLNTRNGSNRGHSGNVDEGFRPRQPNW
jgi:hypothetical protein